jgi:hypothetical protein
MAFFRFIGDPNDDGSGPDFIEWDGFVFTRLDWTEVPDDRCAKLRGNGHFEERSGAVDYSDPEAAVVLDEAPALVKRRGRPPKVRT